MASKTIRFISYYGKYDEGLIAVIRQGKKRIATIKCDFATETAYSYDKPLESDEIELLRDKSFLYMGVTHHHTKEKKKKRKK